MRLMQPALQTSGTLLPEPFKGNQMTKEEIFFQSLRSQLKAFRERSQFVYGKKTKIGAQEGDVWETKDGTMLFLREQTSRRLWRSYFASPTIAISSESDFVINGLLNEEMTASVYDGVIFTSVSASANVHEELLGTLVGQVSEEDFDFSKLIFAKNERGKIQLSVDKKEQWNEIPLCSVYAMDLKSPAQQAGMTGTRILRTNDPRREMRILASEKMREVGKLSVERASTDFF